MLDEGLLNLYSLKCMHKMFNKSKDNGSINVQNALIVLNAVLTLSALNAHMELTY